MTCTTYNHEYKGVRVSPTGRYQTSIGLYGTNRYLGSYDTPEEAAEAYDLAILASGGKLSRMNHPNRVYAVDDISKMSDRIDQILENYNPRHVSASYARDSVDPVDLSEYDLKAKAERQRRQAEIKERQRQISDQIRSAPNNDHNHLYQNSDGYTVTPFSYPISLL